MRIKTMLYAKSKRWVKSCEIGAKGLDFVCKKTRLSAIVSLNAPFFHSITPFSDKKVFFDSFKQRENKVNENQKKGEKEKFKKMRIIITAMYQGESPFFQ